MENAQHGELIDTRQQNKSIELSELNWGEPFMNVMQGVGAYTG